MAPKSRLSHCVGEPRHRTDDATRSVFEGITALGTTLYEPRTRRWLARKTT